MGLLAYLDCCSGVAGDMLLAALVDAGLDAGFVREIPARLGLDHVRLAITRGNVGALAATRIVVEAPQGQPLRTLAAIREQIGRAAFANTIKEQMLAVFHRLAAAESQVHGCGIDEVHFHEIGAVDTLVDIAGVIAGLDHLGVEKVVCSPLPLGRGWINSAHGPLPLPAPAVLALLDGVPVEDSGVRMEVVTPTGAALARQLAAAFGPIPPMRLARWGCGAGSQQRPDGRPNILRLLLGEARSETNEAQTVEIIETTIDDCPAEICGHVGQQLLAAGALDVAWLPATMKKGRPGWLLRVLADPASATDLCRLILGETTAIGLCRRRAQRWTLPRRKRTVCCAWGEVEVKEVETPNGIEWRPEFDSCQHLARRHNVPLRRIYDEVTRLAANRENMQEEET